MTRIRTFFFILALLMLQAGTIFTDPATNQDLHQSVIKQTEAFLQPWFQGDLDKAVEKYLSSYTIQHPELLFSVAEEFVETEPADLRSAENVRKMLKATLIGIKTELWQQSTPPVQILAPIEGETAEEISGALSQLKIDDQVFKSAEMIAFPVRSWDYVAWTGSAGPQHQKMFESREFLEGPLFGVILQLRSPVPQRSVPVLLLWRHEKTEQGLDWKLITLFPVVLE